MRRAALRIQLQRLRLVLVCTRVFVSVICNVTPAETPAPPPRSRCGGQRRSAPAVAVCQGDSQKKSQRGRKRSLEFRPQLFENLKLKTSKWPIKELINWHEGETHNIVQKLSSSSQKLDSPLLCLSQKNPHCRCDDFHINVWPRCRSYSVQEVGWTQTDVKNGSLSI